MGYKYTEMQPTIDVQRPDTKIPNSQLQESPDVERIRPGKQRVHWVLIHSWQPGKISWQSWQNEFTNAYELVTQLEQ